MWFWCRQSSFRERDAGFEDQFSREVAVGHKSPQHPPLKTEKFRVLSAATCGRLDRSYFVYDLGVSTA